jgi:toxin ParE1/3/4
MPSTAHNANVANSKPVRIRPRADAEIDALADYIADDSQDAAMRFLDAVQDAFTLLGEQPGVGSKRYAHLPRLDGLRVWPVPGFERHLIFYIERADYVDVLRVLHGARDIPAALIDDSAN